MKEKLEEYEETIDENVTNINVLEKTSSEKENIIKEKNKKITESKNKISIRVKMLNLQLL